MTALRHRLLTLFTGVAALAALALVAAPPADARGRHSPAEHLARHVEQLGLDEATQAAITEIVTSSKAQDDALGEELRAARTRLRELLSAPETDRAAVLAQADQLDALYARKHRSRLEAVLQIHELLTPEQRAELVKLREQERPWKRGRGPLGRCSADLRAHCADAPDGAAALRCLADRWDALSAKCRDAVAPAPERARD